MQREHVQVQWDVSCCFRLYNLKCIKYFGLYNLNGHRIEQNAFLFTGIFNDIQPDIFFKQIVGLVQER